MTRTHVRTQTVTITIGLTHSDRDADYFPASDGYRDGARQEIITFTTRLTENTSAAEVAEALFVATNAPREVIQHGTLAEAMLEVVFPVRHVLRSLSVGDTVEVSTSERVTILACERTGWSVIASA